MVACEIGIRRHQVSGRLVMDGQRRQAVPSGWVTRSNTSCTSGVPNGFGIVPNLCHRRYAVKEDLHSQLDTPEVGPVGKPQGTFWGGLKALHPAADAEITR